jgi:hypothetical protein
LGVRPCIQDLGLETWFWVEKARGRGFVCVEVSGFETWGQGVEVWGVELNTASLDNMPSFHSPLLLCTTSFILKGMCSV